MEKFAVNDVSAFRKKYNFDPDEQLRRNGTWEYIKWGNCIAEKFRPIIVWCNSCPKYCVLTPARVLEKNFFFRFPYRKLFRKCFIDTCIKLLLVTYLERAFLCVFLLTPKWFYFDNWSLLRVTSQVENINRSFHNEWYISTELTEFN